MPLVEGGRIVEDRYRHIGNDAPIPDRVPVIVPAKRFLEAADALIGRDGRRWMLPTVAEEETGPTPDE